MRNKKMKRAINKIKKLIPISRTSEFWFKNKNLNVWELV